MLRTQQKLSSRGAGYMTNGASLDMRLRGDKSLLETSLGQQAAELWTHDGCPAKLSGDL
jgi:hypothetical protein